MNLYYQSSGKTARGIEFINGRISATSHTMITECVSEQGTVLEIIHDIWTDVQRQIFVNKLNATLLTEDQFNFMIAKEKALKYIQQI